MSEHPNRLNTHKRRLNFRVKLRFRYRNKIERKKKIKTNRESEIRGEKKA